MKKIPIILSILIASLTLSSLFPAKTQAYHKDENGVTWWAVEELLNIPEGNDSENSEEIEAARMLKEGRFWITSIDLTEELVKVLYFDEDEMLKEWGIEEVQPLDYIFLAWFDHDAFGEIGNYNYHLPIESQFSETPHVLYAGGAEPFNTEYFPSNEPIELPLNSTNLIDNHSGHIYLAIFGEGFNSKGYLDYSSCLEDYQEGDICELMFSPGHGYAYFPIREKTTYIDGLGEMTIIEKYPEEANKEVKETEEVKEVEEVKEETTSIVTESTPKAPNTGNYTNSCEKTIEFPWWLAPILVLGNIAALWLFLPQKSRKKS